MTPQYERQEHQGERDRDARRAARIDRRRPRPLAPRHDEQCRDEREHCDRYIDQEDGTPAQACKVSVNEPASEDLSGNRAHAGGDTVPGHRPSASFARKRDVDGRQDLRDHDCGGKALHDPGEHEEARRASHAAQQGGGGEEHEPP